MKGGGDVSVDSLQLTSMLQPNPATRTVDPQGMLSFAQHFVLLDAREAQRHAVPPQRYSHAMRHCWSLMQLRLPVTVSPFYASKFDEGIEKALLSRIAVFDGALGGMIVTVNEWHLENQDQTFLLCAPELFGFISAFVVASCVVLRPPIGSVVFVEIYKVFAKGNLAGSILRRVHVRFDAADMLGQFMTLSNGRWLFGPDMLELQDGDVISGVVLGVRKEDLDHHVMVCMVGPGAQMVVLRAVDGSDHLLRPLSDEDRALAAAASQQRVAVSTGKKRIKLVDDAEFPTKKAASAPSIKGRTDAEAKSKKKKKADKEKTSVVTRGEGDGVETTPTKTKKRAKVELLE